MTANWKLIGLIILLALALALVAFLGGRFYEHHMLTIGGTWVTWPTPAPSWPTA